MAKMGRPKVENAKDKMLALRVTPDKYEQFMEYAQNHDLTMAQALDLAIKKLLGPKWK